LIRSLSFGGKTKQMKSAILLYCYVVVFILLANSQPSQRMGHSSIFLNNGSMVIYGGHNYMRTNYDGKTYDSLLGDMWIFDFNTENWTQVIPDSPEPPARWYHTAVHNMRAQQETMLVFGGVTYVRYDGQRSTTFFSCGRKDVWEFNFATNNWTVLQEDPGNHCSPGTILEWSILYIIFFVISIFLVQ